MGRRDRDAGGRWGVKITKSARLCGQPVPWGYRVAWYDSTGQAEVCYPIGIHLLYRLARRFWEWSFSYRQSAREDRECNLFWGGYSAGRKHTKIGHIPP